MNGTEKIYCFWNGTEFVRKRDLWGVSTVIIMDLVISSYSDDALSNTTAATYDVSNGE